MKGQFERRVACSLCTSGDLEMCLELPPTPLANEFVRRPVEQDLYPTELSICLACGHLQSNIIVQPKKLFDGYVYESSTSPLTVQHLRDEARTIDATLGLRRKEKCFVVEIGSNDGTFLKEMVALGISSEHVLGVEPAETMVDVAMRNGIQTTKDFFTSRLAREMRQIYVAPDVVVANNVFAHVPDVRDCLHGVRTLVEDKGILVMEVAHANDLRGDAWDTIYHEHLSHHALGPLAATLADLELPVFDVELTKNQVGRGSMRVWAGRARVPTRENISKIRYVIETENDAGVTSWRTWRNLQESIHREGNRIKEQLHSFAKPGKNICGYGAPAKMTTLLYGFGLQNFPINKIGDDSKWKQGLYTPGMHVPVCGMEEIVESKPDLVILFAWNFADDLRNRLRGSGYHGLALTPQEILSGGLS